MNVLFGVLVGLLAGWVYYSERVRSFAQQRLSAAPETLQQAGREAASAAAAGAQRASEAIDATPLPDPVKGPATEAAFNVWAAADELGQSPAEGRRGAQPGGE